MDISGLNSPPTSVEPARDMDNKENDNARMYFTPGSPMNRINFEKFATPSTDGDSSRIPVPVEKAIPTMSVALQAVSEKYVFRGSLSMFLMPSSNTNGAVLCTPLVTVLLDGLGPEENSWRFLKNLKEVDAAVLTSVGKSTASKLIGWFHEKQSSPILKSIIGLDFSRFPQEVIHSSEELAHLVQEARINCMGCLPVTEGSRIRVLNLARQHAVGSLDLINLAGDNHAILLIWSPSDPTEPIRRIMFTSGCRQKDLWIGIDSFLASQSPAAISCSQVEMTEQILKQLSNSNLALHSDIRREIVNAPAVKTFAVSGINRHHFVVTKERRAFPSGPKPAVGGPSKPLARVAVSKSYGGQTAAINPKPQRQVSVAPPRVPTKPIIKLVVQPVKAVENKGQCDRKRASVPVHAGSKSSTTVTTKSTDIQTTATVTNPIICVDAAFVPHNGQDYLVNDQFFKIIRAKTYIFGCSEISAEAVLGSMARGIEIWVDQPVVAILARPVEVQEALKAQLNHCLIGLQQISLDDAMEFPNNPAIKVAGAQLIF